MKKLNQLLKLAVMLPLAGIASHLYASDVFVAATIGTCQPVAQDEGCGASLQLYPDGSQTIPTTWVINSITIDYEIVNDSSTSPVEYSLGLEQNPLNPLYFPITSTLAPSEDLSTSAGPFTQGDPGTSPPGLGTPSSLDFTEVNWNDPTSNGVLPAVIFNVSSSGAADFTLESLTLDMNVTIIPEPDSIGLVVLGLALCAAISRRSVRAFLGTE
jgi:hypothetical protein